MTVAIWEIHKEGVAPSDRRTGEWKKSKPEAGPRLSKQSEFSVVRSVVRWDSRVQALIPWVIRDRVPVDLEEEAKGKN